MLSGLHAVIISKYTQIKSCCSPETSLRYNWHNTVSSLQRLLGIQITSIFLITRGFPGGTVVKNLPADAGDSGLIPDSGRFSGGGNGNPLQYTWVENSMDKGAWQATAHGAAKSRTWLSMHTHTHYSTLLCYSRYIILVSIPSEDMLEF